MFDEKYYLDRKLKLQQREQRNLQKYLQATFDYVEEQKYIKEQWDEVLEKEAEAKKKAEEEKVEKK